MTDEETRSPDVKLDRRKLLSLVGTAAIAFAGSVYISTNSARPNKEPPESGSNATGNESDPDESDPYDGVNIDEYGAVPGKDSPKAARQNTEAVRRAAREAGQGGRVYVPGNEYYFGTPAEGFIFRFGDSEPRGISFVGEGPRKSKLTLTSAIKKDRSYRGFTYTGKEADIDHGDVLLKDICFDGNYRNLDMDDGVTVWGFNVYGDGEFTFQNACIRGWWANGARFTGPNVTIRRSTFQENAIGVARAADEPTTGHHIVARPPENRTILIEDSEFLRCSGNVVNRRSGDGDVLLRGVWISGVGIGVMKLSETNGLTRIQNSYVKAQTDWIRENLPSEFDLDGRWFIHRVRGSEHTPTVVLNNVEARDFSRGFILCYQKTDLVLRGDMIAIHDVATAADRHVAIRGDSGIEFDVGAMSIYDTDGEYLFHAPGSTGGIETLSRDGMRLGEIGTLSIGDTTESEPLEPDVVERDDIGINSKADPET